MIVRLVAATVVAATAVLVTWAVYRTLGRPMPRSAWPILIAASLIGYGVYDEYSWRSRTLAALPDSIAVLGEGASRSPFSPWSYLLPRTDRLSLVDTDAVRTHPARPELRLVTFVLLERMQPTRTVREVVDCAERRTAVIGTDTAFDEDGAPLEVRWYPLEDGDPRFEQLCDAP